MSGLLTAFGRLLLILAGYGAASLAASLFLNVVVLWSLGWQAAELPAVMAGSMLISVPLLGLFVAYFAFAPAAFAIALAEIFSLRDWLYHAAAGGAAGLVVDGYFVWATPDGAEVGQPFAFPALTMALAAAGIVGGMAYWTIAGRDSGSWRGGAPTAPAR